MAEGAFVAFADNFLLYFDEVKSVSEDSFFLFFFFERASCCRSVLERFTELRVQIGMKQPCRCPPSV